MIDKEDISWDLTWEKKIKRINKVKKNRLNMVLLLYGTMNQN